MKRISNPRVKSVLAGVEKMLRRRGGKRSRRHLKAAYREAAQVIHELRA